MSRGSFMSVTDQPIRPAGFALRSGSPRIGRGIQRPARRPATSTKRDPTTGIPIGESLTATFGRNRITSPRADVLNPPPPELPQEAISGLESLVSSYNQAYGQARQANEARYQQLLDISRQETQRRQGVFSGMLGVAGETTQQRATDIRSEGARRESDIMQQLARQGMGGTTVGASLRAGVSRDTQADLNRLADTMQQTRLGIMSQQAAPQRTGELGIMERRRDIGPDPAALTSAFGAIGQGFGGQGLTAMIKSLSQLRRG